MWLRPNPSLHLETRFSAACWSIWCPRNEQEKTAVARPGNCGSGSSYVCVVRAGRCSRRDQTAGGFDGMEARDGRCGYRRWRRQVHVGSGGIRGRFRKSVCNGNRCAKARGPESRGQKKKSAERNRGGE